MNKIPLTIGISGHRDAVISDAHRQAIRDIFTDLMNRYPNSPLRLFSPLAVGADTEVAKIFLSLQSQSERDLGLIAPIPYDLDYYKKTQFSTAEELATFEQLLQQSDRHFVLNRLSEQAKETLDNDSNAFFDEINRYYRQCGEFVADSSVVLMVLWENVDNHLEGGSANIAIYKQTGSYKKIISEHIFDNEGSLISIPCRRAGNSEPVELKSNYLDELLKDKSIDKALGKIEELNSKSADIAPEKLEQSAEYLFPNENALSDSNKKLKDYYALIDTQALSNQNKYYWALKALFGLGFFTFLAFESFKHLWMLSELIFIMIGTLAVAFGVFKSSFNSKNLNKYIENRVLAEALRIQFFWHLARLRQPVSNYILRIHKAEYSWIKHIALAIYGITYLDDQAPKTPITTLKEYWIDNQADFFLKNIEKLEIKEKRRKFITKSALTLGFIVLLVICVLNEYDHHHPWLHPLIVIDSVLFGIFAFVEGYYEKRGYEQIKNQYALMYSIYKAASDKITEVDTLDKDNEDEILDNILFLTGKEAVVENGNWYMIYKDKQPEVKGLG